MNGNTRCDDNTNLSARLDPATAKGWLILSLVWAWYALKTLAHLKRPAKPWFMQLAKTVAVHTGGVDHRYGMERGGPQIFDGPPNDDSDCLRGLSPIERMRVRIDSEGRMHKVGYTLRRPRSYRGTPTKQEVLSLGARRLRDTPSLG
jgi:hypothetical protein